MCELPDVTNVVVKGLQFLNVVAASARINTKTTTTEVYSSQGTPSIRNAGKYFTDKSLELIRSLLSSNPSSYRKLKSTNKRKN